MKIIPVLNRLEQNFTNNRVKKDFKRKVSKGDFVSVVYYDIEKEQIRLQQFTGLCVSIKSKGLNTKVSVRNVLGTTVIEQQFFLFSKSLLDIAILRKKTK